MDETQGLRVYKALLCFNSLLSAQMLQSANLRTSLCVAGCTNLDHLLKTRDSSLHLLRKRINETRLLERMCLKSELPRRPVAEPLPTTKLTANSGLMKENTFFLLTIAPAVREWQEGGGQTLSFFNLTAGQCSCRWEPGTLYQVWVKV